MSQLPLLALGTTEELSSPLYIPEGSTVTVGIFSADGTSAVGSGGICVRTVTPGAPMFFARLDERNSTIPIKGPRTILIDRPKLAEPFGAYAEV